MDNREVSAIRVICRFRPLNSSEQSRGDEDLPRFDQGQDHLIFMSHVKGGMRFPDGPSVPFPHGAA